MDLGNQARETRDRLDGAIPKRCFSNDTEAPPIARSNAAASSFMGRKIKWPNGHNCATSEYAYVDARSPRPFPTRNGREKVRTQVLHQLYGLTRQPMATCNSRPPPNLLTKVV